MTAIILPLASLSAKIVLLGGIAWVQLYLLRRAPAQFRSRLCTIALMAIVLLTAVETLAPHWTLTAPIYMFTSAAAGDVTHVSGQTPRPERWLAFIWMAGVVFMLLRAFTGRVTLAIVRRKSTPFQNTAGIDMRIGNVQTPILIGWLRPTILFPEAARQWSDEQRRMVVTHELAHFRQGDVWTNLLGQILRAAFWFHPVVWVMVARLSREQELACDEVVVSAGHSPHDYAAFLLDAARSLKSREMFACAMAGSGARSLKERFANLLDTTPRRLMSRRIALSLSAFAIAAVALLVVHPAWSQNQGQVYKVGNGVMPPKVLTKVDPQYTQEAKDAHLEGTVMLKVIVTAEGLADNITVVSGLGNGLDEKAVEAVQKWTFQPGTKDGAPVAVWATIEVNFRLK